MDWLLVLGVGRTLLTGLLEAVVDKGGCLFCPRGVELRLVRDEVSFSVDLALYFFRT